MTTQIRRQFSNRIAYINTKLCARTARQMNLTLSLSKTALMGATRAHPFRFLSGARHAIFEPINTTSPQRSACWFVDGLWCRVVSKKRKVRLREIIKYRMHRLNSFWLYVLCVSPFHLYATQHRTYYRTTWTTYTIIIIIIIVRYFTLPHRRVVLNNYYVQTSEHLVYIFLPS